MNLFTLSGLLISISSLLFGIFVYWKNKQSETNRLWAIFCFSVAIWGFGGYKIGLTTTSSESLFWWRIAHIGIIFIPVLFYHFVCIFLALKKRILLFLAYLLGFSFLILEWTPWADLFFGLSNMRFLYSSFYWIRPPTPLYSFFVFSWFVTIIYSHYVLYKALKKSFGLRRSQIKYFFLATAVGFAGGGVCFVQVFGINLYPIFNFTVPLYPAIMVYAILKYRLMDIRIAVKRSTVFSGVVIAITAAYVLAAFLVSWLVFGGVYTFKSQIIIGLIVAFLVAFGFRPVYEWLKRITDKFLFKGEYKPQELMADISDVLSRTLDLDRVIQTLKQEITRALRIERMEVKVLEEGEKPTKENTSTRAALGQPSRSRAALGLPLYSPRNDSLGKLIAHFKKQREVLVLEELQRRYADRVTFDKSFLLIKELEKLKTALAVPLFLKEKLVGLFLLGPKKSGDMFTNEDIKTLEAISSQAAIAIENARLYEEMKDFSKTLQKEVDRQTKTLREANIKLEQLDRAKSEFVSIASHQLRTPLSIIKGYLSMILEGLWGEINPEQRRHLEMTYLSNERLIKLIEDLLMVSRIESGRLEFDWQIISLENTVESVVRELKTLADKKGLYLRYEKLISPLPKVKADPLKIRQVIMNLIDNAIRYTEKGGATVRLKSAKDKVIFSIQDTGIGISEKEKVTLFEKFSRGKGVSKIYTEGTGLGLYLAAKLVEAHQGKIWVESEGEDKGSTFFFELPTAQHFSEKKTSFPSKNLVK